MICVQSRSFCSNQENLNFKTKKEGLTLKTVVYVAVQFLFLFENFEAVLFSYVLVYGNKAETNGAKLQTKRKI